MSSPLHLELRRRVCCAPGGRRESNPGPGLVFPLSPTLVLSVFQSRMGKALTQLSTTQSLILGKEKREETQSCLESKHPTCGLVPWE